MSRGIGLIEILVSLAIIGVIFVIFTVSLSALNLRKYADVENVAYGIAEAELETIRTLSSASTTNRTDADFIGISPSHPAWNLLENGQGFLTISNWQNNENIKEITARVEWKDARGVRDVELKTLLGQ